MGCVWTVAGGTELKKLQSLVWLLRANVAFGTVRLVSDELLVEAHGLTKTYPARNGTPPFRAVGGIDFQFGRGEAFGFLGPNGAGKSSTMRMLAAISPVTDGTLRVLGMDPAPPRARRSARGSASCRRTTAWTVS